MARRGKELEAIVLTEDGQAFRAHEARPKTQQQQEDERLLEALAMLGGARVADEDLIYSGRQLIIPEGWTAADAMEYLGNHIEQQEETTEFRRRFQYRPHDGAHALQLALKRVFGTAGLGKPIYHFFGVDRPELISVATGPSETTQVPWGRLEVPLFGGVLMTGAYKHREYGMLFELTISAPRKYKAHVEGLFAAIDAELRTNSLYKGAAVNGAEEPEFIDLSHVDARRVIYSESVRTQLDANVWTLLEHTEKMRDLSLPLKRAVLFEGDFGTGKTLAAQITGQIATKNGWSFIYCRPGEDDLRTVMATARLYQPSVVFFEDVDTIASNGDKDAVSQLLDTFDGITAKGTEIVCILTTNHPDRIVKGMVRPGRLDAVIHFGGLDTGAIEEMAYANLGTELIGQVDWEKVGEAMNVGDPQRAFLPAFAKEAIDRTMRYALSRSAGNPDVKLTTSDFVEAAMGLHPQLDLMLGAGEGEQPESFEQMVARAANKGVSGVGVVRPGTDTTDDPWAVLQGGNGSN